MAMRLLLNARGDTRLDDPDEGVLEEQLVVLGDHLEHVIVPGLGKCRKSKHRENDHDTAGYRPPANPSGRHKGSSRNKLYSTGPGRQRQPAALGVFNLYIVRSAGCPRRKRLGKSCYLCTN